MPDETDKVLSRLEKKISRVYKQADKEMREKLAKQLEEYEEKLEKKKADYAQGKITAKELETWKNNQAHMIANTRGLSETLAKDLVNSDQIASALINGHTPDVYALNYNFGTYQIEEGINANTSFTLYNHEAVERLLVEDPDLLPQTEIDIPKDMEWNKQHINNSITQGILQGESIPKIAKRLQDTVGMDYRAAIRNARTATTGAQSAGRVDAYKRAEAMGIDMRQKWLATVDGRTRHSHVLMDGETIKIGGTFSNGCKFPGDPHGPGHEVYNCFIPETNVACDSEILRSYKHYYEGEIISIKTAGGVNFSCTPNHPILTNRGWVAAKFLNKGDHLIVTSGINNEISRRDPYINEAFPRIETIHQLFDMLRGKRTRALSVNFHGDVPASDVEIIAKKRLLRNSGNTGTRNCVNKFLLKNTDFSLIGKCSFMKHFRGVARTAFSNICGAGKKFAVFFRCLGHSVIHRFRTISNRDIVLPEYSINDLPTNSIFDSESLVGLTGKVFLDNIISVEFGMYSGHVYNLQTDNHYYFVNNIITQNEKKYNGIFAIAHNCRCTLVPVIKGFERDESWKQGSVKGLSYQEWRKQHQVGDSDVKAHYKDSSMSSMIASVKSIDKTDGGKLYKKFQELGENYNLKPAEVWEKYLNGTLGGKDISDIDDILSKYKSAELKKSVGGAKKVNPLAEWKDADLYSSKVPIDAFDHVLEKAGGSGMDDYWKKYTSGKLKDPKLDELLGIKKSAKVPKAPKVSKVPKIPDNTDDYLRGIKHGPDVDEMLDKENTIWKMKDRTKDAFEMYSGSSYTEMNAYLRLKAEGKSEADAIAKAGIRKSQHDAAKTLQKDMKDLRLDQEYYLRRGTDMGDIAGAFMQGDFDNNFHELRHLAASPEGIKEINKRFAGQVGNMASFTSTSSQWDRGFDGELEIIFKAPKGTRGCSIMNISRYGTGEGETLLGDNTKVKFIKFEESDGHFGSDYRLYLEIIPD